MILRPLPASVHSNTLNNSLWKFGLSLAKIQKWLSGQVILEIILKIDVYESFC